MPLAERYEILEKLYDGRTVVVFRARERLGGAGVILKTQQPGAAHSARIRHEYSILRGLDIPMSSARALSRRRGARAVDRARARPGEELQDERTERTPRGRGG